MANRYTVYNPQEYVETYVPLPIQDMKEMLMYKQKEADLTKNALDTSTDPLAKLKVNAGLKIYDRNNNVIDANVGLEKQKNRLMQELDTERSELADALVNKKLTEAEYNSKSRAHINKAKQAYSQLAGTEEILSTINKQNDEMAKNSDYAKSRHYGTELLEYNTNWVNDYMKDGVYKPYTPPSISKEFNLATDLNTSADNWKEHTENAASYLQDGYIRDYKSKGITGTRVYDYVNQMWDSKSFGAKADSDLQIKDRLRSQGIDLNTKASEIIPGYKGNGTIFDVLDSEAKQKYALALGDKLIHQDVTTDLKNDSRSNMNLGRKWELEDRMSEVQTVPSDLEVNSYAKFAEENPGLVTKDGKIDWVGVMKNPSGAMSHIMDVVSSVFTPNPATAISGILAGLKPEKTPTEKATALNGLMKETAKIVGYMGDGSGKISSKDYQNIMDIYKNFTNLRGTAIGYNAEQSDVYTNRLEQVPDNYIYTNEKGEVLSDELRNEVISKIRASKSKELSEKDAYVAGKDRVRIGENKQTSFVEKIKLSDGSTVYAQPQFKEEKGHYDQLANIFDKTDQYLSTGELSDDDKKLMSEVPKGITNVSSITKLPTGDVIIGQTFKAADGPKEQYFIKDADGNMSFKSRTASELAQLYHSQFDQSNVAPKNAARKIETVKNYTTP